MEIAKATVILRMSSVELEEEYAVSFGLSYLLVEFTITDPILVYNTTEHTFQKKMNKKLLK